MSRADHGSPRPPFIKGLCLVAALVLVCCAVIVPAHANTCFRAVNLVYTYYSSAAHTKIVGRCIEGLCGGTGCTGTTSNYVTVTQSVPCEVCGVP